MYVLWLDTCLSNRDWHERTSFGEIMAGHAKRCLLYGRGGRSQWDVAVAVVIASGIITPALIVQTCLSLGAIILFSYQILLEQTIARVAQSIITIIICPMLTFLEDSESRV